MSRSPNNKNKNDSKKNLNKSKDKDKQKNPINIKTSPITNNNKLTNDSNSTKNTNANASIKKDKDLLSYFSYQAKPVIEENELENQTVSRKKKMYKPPTVIDKKKIKFQRQSDKEILEFSLFDDNLIFKDLNRSYLQDEYSDDGSESSEEKIRNAKIYLSQEIEQSTNDLIKNLKKNEDKPLLSRTMKFKNEEKK